MRKFYLIGFLLLLLFDTFSQVAFKFSATNCGPATIDVAWLSRVVSEKWTYGAILGYVGAFVCWMTLLKHAPIGPAFAATHADIVTVALISVIFLNEHLTPIQWFGCALILAGIAVLGRAETRESHPSNEIVTQNASIADQPEVAPPKDLVVTTSDTQP